MVGYWLMLSILAFVTLFGAGMAINMIFRRWWAASLPFAAFSVYLMAAAGARMVWPEWILYGVAAAGVILSCWTARVLGKRGYPLFS
ncbi:MAG: hypothetical protein K6T81_04105 [Alicyclobacillus macrosporangiidus]|uniref:hypothetical protein n=1 Tax=Alicyclobacillus macrosporangiidus TaxID=392015 RepID=UPI0026EEE8A5|nr:hypothetical protein [Alicyclobacillus macrosporangiidus]MCL6597901.1 hypothetical protein [Alicyclobacillus macrosporangiidus]